MKKDASVSDEWLTNNVTPRISAAFGPAVGAILARPLLWAAFDPVVSERVFSTQRYKIVSSFLRLQRPIGDTNPVDKVTVIASEGQFKVTVVASEGSYDDLPFLGEQEDHIFSLTKRLVPLLCSWGTSQSRRTRQAP